MKPDKHFAGAVGIILVAASLIALTWVATVRAVQVQREATLARVTATLSNQALTFTEQISRQILSLDQTLRILENAWETNPGQFDLEAWKSRAPALNGLGRDLILADDHGIIRQSTVVEAINQSAANLDYFIAFARGTTPPNRLYVGPASIGPVMREWHMNAARALHAADGSFAGVIDADYRISAITDVFTQTDLGTGAFLTLVGLNDGKLRAAVGPASIDPDASIIDTPMFRAISRAAEGIWVGPSATDAVTRIHAFRQIPDRNLAIVVAMDRSQALAPADEWQLEAYVFAGCITALLGGLALVLLRGTQLARRRETAIADDRAVLAAANAQLEVARALADARAEQIEATLAGMTDGVAMIDAHMCLAEWNTLFSDIAGVPPEILRVGLPMEDILRAQILNGQFGPIADADAEIARRMQRLREAQFGVVERQRPDGRTIELRRKGLPDGGFVTLYADITDRKLAEEALRRAQAEAEAANAAKSRFVAIVSHELRTPLNALLNTVRLLSDSVLTPAQQSLVTVARQSGDVLFGLINDILDMSQIEAGKLTVRPSLFEVRPLLESCLEMFAAQAADKGVTLRLEIMPGTPDLLLTDPGRLRQVQLNLLSNAVKYARSGIVTLIAAPGDSATSAVRFAVRDPGPVIEESARKRLFRPFSRIERPGDLATSGSGLGLAICREIMALLDGAIGHETWVDAAGQEGNLFWTALPVSALPYRGGAMETATESAPAAGSRFGFSEPGYRQVPRTRILLAEDVPASQFVTAALLRRAGHAVDIVSNGEQAVEAMRRKPYDIVFMDVFMPVMGGHEATRIIRSLPGPAGQVPIIALTAQVSDGDDANLEASGMNGTLGKPVSLAEMLDTLVATIWSKPGRPADRSPVSSAQAGGDTMSLSVERIEELKAGLLPEQLADLVEECLTDLEHRMPALRRGLYAGAAGAVMAHAHTMAGVAAAYGLTGLEKQLRSIMAAAHDNQLGSLDSDIMTRVEAEFAHASRLLRAVVRVAVSPGVR
jgi:signal transduction histidine kinase/FixJ family two-component response regulator